MPTAAPVTSTRLKPPTSSNHSDLLFSLSPSRHHPPSSTCDQRPVFLRDPLHLRSLYFLSTTDWTGDWSDELFLVKQGGALLYPLTLQGKSTALPDTRRVAGAHGLPYSVLLWQAASPGSSVGHVSPQRRNVTSSHCQA